MKIHLYLLLVFSTTCLAQNPTNDMTFTSNINKCEGDTFDLFQGGIILAHQKFAFYFTGNCGKVVEYNKANKEEFTITGGTLINKRGSDYYNPGDDYTGYQFDYVRFVATESTQIIIKTVHRVDPYKIDEECKSYVTDQSSGLTYTYTYIYNVKILPKKAPTLTTSKDGIQLGETFSLFVSGCDPAYWGVHESFNYSNCQSQKPPSGKYGSGYDRDDISRLQTISSSTTFYVRCTDNNCYSDWSNPVHVDVLPTSNPCADPNIDYINSIEQSSRKDYHYYTVEHTVCKKSGNSKCTVQNVFNFLRSSSIYNAPIAVDIPETFPAASIIGGWDLGNWELKVPLLGSDLVYKIDNTPVYSCKKVSLPSAIGMAVNLVALAYSITQSDFRPYLATKNATPNNGWTANPITHVVDDQAHSITNYTDPDHVLFPGRVIRKIVEDCDEIKVITIGTGLSKRGDNIFGEYMSSFNAKAGKLLFNNIDQRLIYDFNR